MMACANLRAQDEAPAAGLDHAIQRVLRGNRHIPDQEVEALERRFAAHIGAACAIGVANGTGALELAPREPGLGLGAGVITASHAAVAAMNSIERFGAVA